MATYQRGKCRPSSARNNSCLFCWALCHAEGIMSYWWADIKLFLQCQNTESPFQRLFYAILFKKYLCERKLAAHIGNTQQADFARERLHSLFKFLKNKKALYVLDTSPAPGQNFCLSKRLLSFLNICKWYILCFTYILKLPFKDSLFGVR